MVNHFKKRTIQQKDKPFLLIPIETKAREFHAKLLLSCFAAAEGFKVVLGEHNEIYANLKFLPRGIFIDKSIARTKIRSFQINRKIGNCVVAWCEEGLTFRDTETYLKERISEDAYKMVENFFAWGRFHKDTLLKVLESANDKIVCAGNPRFDLLRYPFRKIFYDQADSIRRKYNSFILINTNFSRYNHYYGRDFVIKNMKVQGRIKNEEDEAFLVKWADYLGEMYHHFVSMVEHLNSSFPEHTIIIRPHPSESQITWKNNMKPFRNVKVIQEGNVISWIMSSDVMIHNSCTTGVEAYILETPSISYCPITSEKFDSYLPNAVNRKAFSLDELTEIINEVFEDPKEYMEKELNKEDVKTLIEDYINGAYGPMACEQIVSKLKELANEKSFVQPLNSPPYSEILLKKINNYILLGKKNMRRIIRGRQGGTSYYRQKFPGLDFDEIQQAINILQKTVNQFDFIAVQKIPETKSCFFLYRDK